MARIAWLCATVLGPIESRAPENTVLLQRTVDYSLAEVLEFDDGKRMDVDQVTMDILEHKAPTSRMRGPPVVDKDAMSHRSDVYKDNMGIYKNAEGDFVAFFINTGVWIASLGFGIFLLSWWRSRYPVMYQTSVLGENPRHQYKDKEWETNFFGWIPAISDLYKTSCFRVSCPWQSFPEEALSAGLDQALGLYYCQLCSRILLTLALPSTLIFMPLNWFYGGDFAGDDRLSRLGFANVDLNNPLVWFYSFVVWMTVYVINSNILQAQTVFIHYRQTWLKQMPCPRANTVLVERIPEDYCCDIQLKAFFDDAMGDDAVETAYVLRKTDKVVMAQKAIDYYTGLLDVAQQQLEETGERPMHMNLLATRNSKGDFVAKKDAERARALSLMDTVDSIEKYTEELENARAEYDEACASIDAATLVAESNPNMFWSTALVTFRKRQVAELAFKEIFTDDMDQFVVSRPPAPEAIDYLAFCLEDDTDRYTSSLEFVLLCSIFAGFLPFVVLLCSVCKLNYLTSAFPLFDHLVDQNPILLSMWDSTVVPVVLSNLMGFVPYFMELAMQFTRTEISEASHQYKIQVWYFYFLMIFVVLVTSIGSSLVAAFKDIWSNPNIVFERLAMTMPASTHFYLNYLPIQWCSFAMVMTRWVPLGKYLTLRKIVSDERAKELSEPEAQDWYGMGARSSRLACYMVICIVFCTLCPMITIVGWLTFQFARMIYSYLFVFAETKKEDLGGVFWCSMLKHTQVGVFIYVVLMASVLFARCANPVPGIIATSALIPAIYFYGRLGCLQWQYLPNRMCKDDTMQHSKPSGMYCQPELLTQ